MKGNSDENLKNVYQETGDLPVLLYLHVLISNLSVSFHSEEVFPQVSWYF